MPVASSAHGASPALEFCSAAQNDESLAVLSQPCSWLELLGSLSAMGSHYWKEQVRVWMEGEDMQSSKPVRSEQSPVQGPSHILWF